MKTTTATLRDGLEGRRLAVPPETAAAKFAAGRRPPARPGIGRRWRGWVAVLAGVLLAALGGVVPAGGDQSSVGKVVSFAAGDSHSLAILKDGSLWAWGGNSNGQLGNGSFGLHQQTPVQVGTDRDWAVVAAAFRNSLALKEDGSLWAWGNNFYGQVGDATTVHKASPVRIGTASDWAAVAVGSGHSLALKQDGTLWAWGYNGYGQLGDGTSGGGTDKLTPVQVGSASDWAAVAAGYHHTVALKSDGSLWAWGRNSYGQLGDGTSVNRHSPVRVGTATDWAMVSTRDSFTMALKQDGTLWAWGCNDHGFLGDGPLVTQYHPIRIGVANDWAMVSAGMHHTLALKADGTLWAWGWNEHGEFGDDSFIDRNRPVQAGTADDWSTVVAGTIHSLALKSDSTLWAWGGRGCLGIPIDDSTPGQVGTATDWTMVDGGSSHSLAIKDDGTLWTWGNNEVGALGDGTSTIRVRPVQIGGAEWAAATAGVWFTLAVKTDGTLWAWGNNEYGQVGNGTTVNKSTPARVGTDTDWAAVAAGNFYTVALKSDGSLWAWGYNSYGQLGDGTTAHKTTPTQVGSDSTWVAVAAGNSHTVALKIDGSLWAWGDNHHGQLGDGTRGWDANKSSPVRVGTSADWAAVAAGGWHTMALKIDGSLWTWGGNADGQLGKGMTGSVAWPQKVVIPLVAGIGFELWRQAHFTPAECADPGISGPLACPSGDEVANLAKYAFGLDPHARATNADLVQARMSGGVFHLIYRERRNAADIDYLPEVSEDLVNWSAASVEELSRLPDDDEAFEVVTVQALLPDSAAKGFVRVRIMEK